MQLLFQFKKGCVAYIKHRMVNTYLTLHHFSKNTLKIITNVHLQKNKNAKLSPSNISTNTDKRHISNFKSLTAKQNEPKTNKSQPKHQYIQNPNEPIKNHNLHSTIHESTIKKQNPSN